MKFYKKDYPTPRNLAELLHRLITEHPRLNVQDIAGKLWGEDKIERKVGKLYRQANPYDENTHIKAVDLPRLIEILSEGLTPDEDEEFGGAAITIYFNKRAGRVCHRQPEPVAETRDAIPVLCASIDKCSDFVKEANRILNSGDTTGLTEYHKRSYEARSSIAVVDSAVEEMVAKKR